VNTVKLDASICGSESNNSLSVDDEAFCVVFFYFRNGLELQWTGALAALQQKHIKPPSRQKAKK
jgi:hypothetical protein